MGFKSKDADRRLYFRASDLSLEALENGLEDFDSIRNYVIERLGDCNNLVLDAILQNYTQKRGSHYRVNA